MTQIVTELDYANYLMKINIFLTFAPSFFFVYTPLVAVATSFIRTKKYPVASNAKSDLKHRRKTNANDDQVVF